jgi:SAM-dependent methyltransferase
MVDYAQDLEYAGPRPVLAVHDLATQPLPLDTGAVHLVCMTAVLHVLEEPLPALAEVRRVLASSGVFLLHDWIRTSLQAYLTSRLEGQGEALEASRRCWFRLFPMHNKYTEDDWQWLLAEAGFTIQCRTQVRPNFRLFVARP